MGMAASQARLLTITARLHDVEYQAQSIQNAKTQLATQNDAVYQEYLEALDSTTLTIKDYYNNIITANFKNLCGIDAVNTSEKFAIRDEYNRLVVEDDIAEGYRDFKSQGGDDAYLFAMWMLDPTIGNPNELKDMFQGAETNIADNSKTLTGKQETLDKMIKEALDDDENYSKDDLLNAIADAENSGDDAQVKKLKETLDSYEGLENSYRYTLYQQYAKEIFTSNGDDGEQIGAEIDFDQNDFNYYVRMYQEISASGDSYVAISEFNGIEGMNGEAATDSEWLKKMLESGRFTIETVKSDAKGTTFTTTSPTTDSYLNYTTTTTIDKKAMAKAEAEYEHATKQIDQKDKKFDMDLSKLETERTALTTEYDSVKKVVSDNIERTFGIFS